VKFLGNVSRKKTVSFIISDFLDRDYLSQLKIISKKHELISIMLSDPGDFTLPESGIISLQDFETGKPFTIDASSKESRHAYKIIKKQEFETSRQQLKRANIDTILLSTTGSVTKALTHYFMMREKRIH